LVYADGVKRNTRLFIGIVIFINKRGVKLAWVCVHMVWRGKLNIAGVLALIRAGCSNAQIARHYKVSPSAVSQFMNDLRLAGRIQRIKTYPATYRVIEPEERNVKLASMGDGDVKLGGSVGDGKRVVEPHKFGEWFVINSGSVVGGRAWHLGSTICRRWVSADFTIIAYPKRFVVWLKTFNGKTPLDMVADGRARIRRRAELFAAEQGLVFEFEKYAGAREWNTPVPGQGLSKDLIDGLKLREGARVVGDTVWSTDKSHVGRAEFGTLKPVGKSLESADLYAKRLNILLSSDAFLELPVRLENFERLSTEAIERLWGARQAGFVGERREVG
jgi:hypothetical protein